MERNARYQQQKVALLFAVLYPLKCSTIEVGRSFFSNRVKIRLQKCLWWKTELKRERE
ncbi:unnamed protein product [Amoebophrya sp. A25]|nr:unnamed protein product [Amoebophrya sp. A25]|eukprot:GSA25T00011684001.1